MPQTPEADDAKRESFLQTCETARHYGNMRFLFSTLWTVVMSGLVSVDLRFVLSTDKTTTPVFADPWPAFVFHLAALGLAAAFVAGEFRMSKLVVGYQEMARDNFLPYGLKMVRGSETWKRIVPWVMRAPLAVAGLYFVLRLGWSPSP